ncbi:MAG: hypothetical protein ACYCS7_05110 [Acidimicrobiales bacterium]
MSLFKHDPHPRIQQRKVDGPPRQADALPTGTTTNRFNSWLAIKITSGVGTMWCAYAFGLITLISLPAAIRGGVPTLISWIAQTFLQLVLLSIIIVGQNINSVASDKRAEATYEDADAVLHTALAIEAHLQAQDAAIERIIEATSPPALS